MKVYLDNIMVDPEDLNNSLRHPVITQQRINDTGDRAFSFTGELEFSGKEYTYIYAQLKSSPNALENRIVLKMVDDCCSQNLVYEFWITHESLQWCENECTVKVSATEKSDSVDQYTCFKNTIIWDNHAGFQQVQHPRFAYCNELRPNWLGDLMIIMVMALYTAFLTMGPVIALIALIIDGINLIIGVNNNIINALNSLLPSGSQINTVDPIDLDGDPSTTAFQQFSNWINNLLAMGVGCGRKHPSPLVRAYIENVCSKCGVSFSSSIYNNPNSDYYWAAYVNAPINKGTQENDGSTYWIPENAPILSGLQLLDQLSPVTNSKFAIKNNTLYFERRDFFIPATPWLDLTTFPKDKIKSICWSWSQKTRASYADLYYQKDGINWVGSEAVARWGDYVDWNNSPYSSLQKGAYKPLIEFAAQRFRDDGIDRDILTFYEDQPTIGPLIQKYKNAMLMNSHNCFTPMLLIWDPASGTENAFCNKFTNIYHSGLGVGANQFYNYPYWFKQGYAGNLYDRFHEIENPRTSGYQGLDFVAEIEYDCNLLSLVDVDGTVRTSEGDTTNPTIITIDREKGILIIKGTV
jgi:hypothetical protein